MFLNHSVSQFAGLFLTFALELITQTENVHRMLCGFAYYSHKKFSKQVSAAVALWV
jgi:hypothetical protein